MKIVTIDIGINRARKRTRQVSRMKWFALISVSFLTSFLTFVFLFPMNNMLVAPEEPVILMTNWTPSALHSNLGMTNKTLLIPSVSTELNLEPIPKNKTILIYSTHNRESWIPELKNVTDANMAFDPRINVTLLGKRLSMNLERKGLSTFTSDKDYPSSVKQFNYAKSYVYSKETIVQAVNENPTIKYLFDIHRDSLKRSETTAKINNTSYAKIFFVVGGKNPNRKKNLEFAQKINDILNKKYPGISKGIYEKGSYGNGEYNQSLSPNSSLIEIGGVENTLEESYRTIDILSEVISQVCNDASDTASILAMN